MLENAHLPTYRRASQTIPDRKIGRPDGGKARGDSPPPGPAQEKRHRPPGRLRWAREAGKRLRAALRTMFGLEGLAVAGFGVLWGRVSFYDRAWPFLVAVSVLAVARPGRHKSLAMTVPGVLIGLATVQPWPVVAEYGLALAAALSGLSALRSSPAMAGLRGGWGRESLEMAGLPVMVSLLAAMVRSLVGVIAGRAFIDFVWIGVEAFAVAFVAYVLEFALPEPEDWRGGRRLTPEELLGVSFLGAAAVMGLRGLTLWSLLDLSGLAAGWAVLIAASAGGAAAGGAVGLGLTLLQLGLGPTGGATQAAAVAALGIAGFAAGLLRPGGRAVAAVAYVAGYVLALPRGGDVYLFLSQIATAVGTAAAFLLTPVRLPEAVAKALPQERSVRQEARQISTHFRYQVSRRLNDYSRIFDELGRTFAQIPAQVIRPEPTAAVGLIQDIANSVCGKCEKHERCWEDDAYRTYQEFLELLGIAEDRGAVAFADIPGDLRTRCLHPRKVLTAVNERLAMEKLETEWSRRLGESRRIVSTQLEGVADVMRGLAREALTGVEHLEKVEARVSALFWRHGLRPVSVEASSGGEDRIVLDVYFTPARKGWRRLLKRRCQETGCEGAGDGGCDGGCINRGLLAELSKLLGCRAGISDFVCAANLDKRSKPPLVAIPGAAGRLLPAAPVVSGGVSAVPGPNVAGQACLVRLQPVPGLKVDWHGASQAKDDGVVSGDSFSVVELADGRAVVFLSDGMGTGLRASLESGATVSMLEELLRAGLDREFAVKTVNSVLLLRSPEEVFATVDLLVVDRHSGLTEFIKIGASPSFVKRGREVGVISANTLPIGILSSVDAEVVTRMLRPGDIVVMATDGLTSVLPGERKDDAAGPGKGEDTARPGVSDQGEAWVAETLADMVSDDPKEIVETLLAKARARRGALGSADDMTVVAVRISRVEAPDEAVHLPGWASSVRAASFL